MSTKINAAIVGAGKISRRMAAVIKKSDAVNLYAIASRDIARAEEFRVQCGCEKAYGSYDAMLADERVELVYIGIPNSFHAPVMKKCLEAGKHVLCEKPFTLTAEEAREIFTLAKEKNIFVGEAVWTRFLPLAEEIKRIVSSGEIGAITSLSANLGYTSTGVERIQDPKLGGGALYDLGPYVLSFAALAFGLDVSHVCASGVMSDLGVDLRSTLVLKYADGRSATLTSVVDARTEGCGYIYGERGYIIVEDMTRYSKISVYRGAFRDFTLDREIISPDIGDGFEYQLQAAADAINSGKTEYTELPYSEILKNMEIMDTAFEQMNYGAKK